jgi:predicted permease
MKLPRWRRSTELNDEITSHLEMAKRDRIERGQPTEEAEHAARREFGNANLVRSVTRDQWRGLWLEEFLQDLRFGTRTLRKNPGFAAIVILTLALGIGANTSLFSVVNGVLLNPLPYPNPEQLVTLHESKPNFDNGAISYLNFRDWRKENRTFSSMAIARGTSLALTGRGEAEQLRGRYISYDYFSVLGINPVLGRTFAPGEDEIAAAPIALIGEGLWKRKFGGSSNVLGQAITLDGTSFTIVGVTPGTFDLFLRSTFLTEVYLPIGQWNNPALKSRGAGLGIHGIGRLKSGVTIEQARADMDGVSRTLAAAYPDTDKDIGASLIPLRKEMLGDVQPVLLVLLGAVGFVLLIACVNVANLLLARTTGRTREFAVRAALGAGRGRLIRQLLTESVLLALAGGGAGLMLAQWATRAALAVLPQQLPRSAEIRVNTQVLLFTLAVSLVAGILFGLAPALKTSQQRLHETLKEAGRGSSGVRNPVQSIFVVLEMAMALVLLIGAGLMIRSLGALWSVDPGFQPHNVMTFGLSFPPSMFTASPDAVRAYVREIDRRFGAVPGVQAVSQSWGAVPLASEDDDIFWLESEPKPVNQSGMKGALQYIVGPDYLNVMGIPLLRGRFFDAHDDEHSPRVAVIDEIFAKKYFGDADPLGKRIVMPGGGAPDPDPAFQIVGIVGHVNQWGLDSDATEILRTELYLCGRQMPDRYMTGVPGGGGTLVMLRTDGTAKSLPDALRRASQEMKGDQAIYSMQSMDSIIFDTLASRRFSMILLAVFAGLALLLSSVGIYGVISYLAGQRTREIGIRVALGARRIDVLQMVLGHGLKMALLGVVIGILAATGLTQLMKKMLYGVSPIDPVTFASVAILLTMVALAACYIPARSAMRVDPVIALRYE